MASHDRGNNTVNPRAVDILQEGMREIRESVGDFSKSVAAWRLHMRMENTLGKRQLPPPDYLLARVTDDNRHLAERRRDQIEAREMKNWDRVAQINQEFANIDTFERTYGSTIDDFKEVNDDPSRHAYRVERQITDLDGPGNMGRNALRTESGYASDTRGNHQGGGGCPEGEKIGAGGQCQPFSTGGLYANASGGGSRTDAPSGSQNTSAPPVPAYKKYVFKGEIKQKEWNDFYQAVTQLPGVTPLETKLYMQMFAAEGGMELNPAPNSTAFGGITQDALGDMIKKGYVTGIPRGTETTELTIEQMAESYRGYFDMAFHTVGGHGVLDQIGNDQTAIAVADSLFMHGTAGGAGALQEAINKVPSMAVTVDNAMGPTTLGAIQIISADPEKNDFFLNALVGIRIGKASGEKPRIENMTKPTK